MKNLKQPEELFWLEYLKTTPPGLPEIPRITASYAGNKLTTDDLLHLYLIDKKTASSSILEDFTSANEPIPKIGDFWIILNSKDEPSCILRTERVVVFNKFKHVTKEIAIAEGEGDLSLEYWRRVHKDFYSPFLKSWGLTDIEDATVITEFFKIVYKR